MMRPDTIERRWDRLPGGLTLLPRDGRAAAFAVVASILGVTVFIAVLDLLFHQSLPPGYVAFFTSPLFPRMPLQCALAAIEEVKFRLLLMTALVGIVALWRGKAPAAWVVTAILLAQLANVAPLVIADPVYGTLRYWAVGTVWGWLYWRHGWFAALAAHASTHLLLDPLLLALLR